jgi:hypothetical protein
VRVQTPKVNKLDSPSRVKRLLSFTDLEVEGFEEDIPLGGTAKEAFESPSEMARTKNRKGLAAGKKAAKPVFSMTEEDLPAAAEVDEDTTAESIEGVAVEEDYYGDGGGGFGDDGDGVDELAMEEDAQEEEEEREEEVEDWEVVEVDDQVEEDEDEEDDVEEISPPPQQAKRGKRPPNAWSKPLKPSKTPTARSKAKSSSTQPAPKRARTTASPKIKQHVEKPRPRSPSVGGDGARNPPPPPSHLIPTPTQI